MFGVDREDLHDLDRLSIRLWSLQYVAGLFPPDQWLPAAHRSRFGFLLGAARI